MEIDRPCPVCGATSDRAKLYAAESVNHERLSGFSFASRKVPEFMSHRLVVCGGCDLVYAPQPPAANELANAYHQADYDSSDEADDAADTYAQAIQKILPCLPQRESALEIGTGTGTFLKRLKNAGFTKLFGIEPSTAAIDAANPEQRLWIQQGVFKEGLYAPSSFDLICCFMTMEHVHDPAEVARSVLGLLRPGGAFVTVTHNRRSVVNRLLGKRSPIIDIEHMQLFSDDSLNKLFELSGYERIAIKAFSNRYSLRYWLRLTPLPRFFKDALTRRLTSMGVDRLKLTVNVGNTMAVGFKPLKQAIQTSP
jgi:SAM-dependent methyltransferase